MPITKPSIYLLSAGFKKESIVIVTVPENWVEPKIPVINIVLLVGLKVQLEVDPEAVAVHLGVDDATA